MRNLRNKHTYQTLDFGRSIGCSVGSASYVIAGQNRPESLCAHDYLRATKSVLRTFGDVVRPDLVAVRCPSRNAGKIRKKTVAEAVALARQWALSIGAKFEIIDSGEVKRNWSGWGNASNQAVLDESEARGFRLRSCEGALALATLDLCLKKASGIASQTGIGARFLPGG